MKLSPKTLSTKQQQVLWRAENRNAISKIAADCGVSRTMVERVLKFELASGERRVEKALAALDCPGFEDYKQASVAAAE
jgi:hypothetical protein